MNEGGRRGGRTALDNVDDRPADGFGEAHRITGDVNLGGEGNAVNTPDLPDVEGAVGLLNRESMHDR